MTAELGEEVRQKLQGLFERYDADGSGAIDVQELGKIMRLYGMNPSLTDIEETVAGVDKNANGALELAEFMELMATKIATQEICDPVQDLIDAFKVFDEDGSGLINIDILREIMTTEGEPLSEEELESMLKAADQDGDGNITYEELVKTHFFGHKKRKREGLDAKRGVRQEKRTIAQAPGWTSADPARWEFPVTIYSGEFTTDGDKVAVEEEVSGAIAQGLEKLKASPADYRGLYYMITLVDAPEEEQTYTLVRRTGSGFQVKTAEDGEYSFVEARYCTLAKDATVEPDEYTDSVLSTYKGKPLAKARSPGRLQGVADVPGLRVWSTIEPSDIVQGGVGDCWLLSAISALSEYHGAIEHLFRKTPNITSLPRDEPAQVTVTLWDLATWQEVDIVIDERLCFNEDDSGLQGCGPSAAGDLWPCYLEKALAIHCGGWDKIDGGEATHAWRLVTGSRDQYQFRHEEIGWTCLGTLNPETGEREALANSPADTTTGVWAMPWPEAGGGGDMELVLSSEDFFDRMCAFEDHNFIMCASTEGKSDKEDHEGIVDNHCYAVLKCVTNPAGNNFHLVQVRNPWNSGEFKSGRWMDDGEGWKEHPEVKEALKPVQADDGVFWLDRDEFFNYFTTVLLCAVDMSKFSGAHS